MSVVTITLQKYLGAQNSKFRGVFSFFVFETPIVPIQNTLNIWKLQNTLPLRSYNNVPISSENIRCKKVTEVFILEHGTCTAVNVPLYKPSLTSGFRSRKGIAYLMSRLLSHSSTAFFLSPLCSRTARDPPPKLPRNLTTREWIWRRKRGF